MNDDNKHRRAEPKRAARRGSRIKGAESAPVSGGLTDDQVNQIRDAVSGSSRRHSSSSSGRLDGILAFFRTTPGMITFAVVVLGLALVVRFAFGGDGDEPVAKQGPPGAVNGTFGGPWTAPGGAPYEVSVEPLSDLVSTASPSGCIGTPKAGTTNLHFKVTIINKGTAPADLPYLQFATNLKPWGALDQDVTSFEDGSKRVDIPQQGGTSKCTELARIFKGSGPQLAPGDFVEFDARIGPVKLVDGGIPAGVTVFVRQYIQDSTQKSDASPSDFLANFKRF